MTIISKTSLFISQHTMSEYRSNFLEIDTITGASTDDKHKGWIDIHSFSSSITGEGNYNAQKQKTWRASHSDMTILKNLDQTSPKLAEAASLGSPFNDVTIEVCETVGDKECYMTYKMSKVVVVNYLVTGMLSERPLESVGFRYEKIQWTYQGGFIASWTIPQHKG